MKIFFEFIAFKQGEFEDLQCDGDECWCVDEFGIELASSRGLSDQPNKSCLQLRSDSSCPGLLCRLGCDYGFAIDEETNCPLCECRNPCDVIQCPDGQVNTTFPLSFIYSFLIQI